MRRLFWVGLLFSVTAMAATGYKVIKEIKIGGQARWDYITADSAARRLYVTNGTRVVVVDLDKGTVVGEVPDTQGVHGVAIAGTTSLGRHDCAVAKIFPEIFMLFPARFEFSEGEKSSDDWLAEKSVFNPCFICG